MEFQRKCFSDIPRDVVDESFNMFIDISHFEEADLYYIVYVENSLSKKQRQRLKNLGWKLQRHSRTNEEIWVWDK